MVATMADATPYSRFSADPMMALHVGRGEQTETHAEQQQSRDDVRERRGAVKNTSIRRPTASARYRST